MISFCNFHFIAYLQKKEYFKFDNRFWRIILLLTSISAVFSQCIFFAGRDVFPAAVQGTGKRKFDLHHAGDFHAV